MHLLYERLQSHYADLLNYDNLRDFYGKLLLLLLLLGMLKNSQPNQKRIPKEIVIFSQILGSGLGRELFNILWYLLSNVIITYALKEYLPHGNISGVIYIQNGTASPF